MGEAGSGEEHAPSHEPEKLATASTAESPVAADAVLVVDTQQAHVEAADLGEVLARVQGINVRREGGLGTATQLSLDGAPLDRVLVDGVPLEAAGFSMEAPNVTPNLFQRADIYRGVVPIRLGVPALNGVMNLVSRYSDAPGLRASYQLGSFGTHRATLEGRYRHEPSGVIASGVGFVDVTRNDYRTLQGLADAAGRVTKENVSHFHDAYAAYGLRLRAGVVDRSWADRLSLEGFVSGYEKELQHNLLMTVPYGEVEYGETVFGATARYEVGRNSPVSLSAVASFARHHGYFLDPSTWVYNWHGERVQERTQPGETGSNFSNAKMARDDVFARALLQWQITHEHTLRVSVAPQLVAARTRAVRDLTHNMLTVVTGAEYQADLFDQLVSNIVFVKDYVYRTSGQGKLTGTGMFEPLELSHHAFGAGDALCVRATPWLRIKAAYEYATRAPSSSELLGDTVFVIANLQLEPEVSHNLNIGPQLALTDTAVGSFSADINAFWRNIDRQIVLLGADRLQQFMNLYRSRSLGVDSAVGWTSPARFVSLGGTLSWQDTRNESDDGPFAQFKGERIPNRPYLFGSWNARVRIPTLPGAHDTLEPYYYGRYTHNYLVGWEGQGLRDFKQGLDDQVTHTVGLTWNLAGAFGHVAATFEVSNLTDARIYDVFGVQRPGRAYYLKLSGEI